MLLNKFVKESLLQVLSRKDVQVSLVGNESLYAIVVRDAKGQKIFEYTHKKEADSVVVNREFVALESVPSDDMVELRDALKNIIAQAKKVKQIESDRKNMRDFDIRAVEFLKQYNVR